MTTWRRVQGDTSDTIDVEVLGIDDATAATSWAANVWVTGASAVSGITAAATSASVVRVTLGAWLTTATPGAYNLEITATISGNPRTWPEGTPDQIIVRAQGA